jgi:glutathione S-transferase
MLHVANHPYSRVLLHELNIEFEDKKYTYDSNWPSVNDSLGVSLTGKLPMLEIDGHRLSQVRARFNH